MLYQAFDSAKHTVAKQTVAFFWLRQRKDAFLGALKKELPVSLLQQIWC